MAHEPATSWNPADGGGGHPGTRAGGSGPSTDRDAGLTTGMLVFIAADVLLVLVLVILLAANLSGGSGSSTSPGGTSAAHSGSSSPAASGQPSAGSTGDAIGSFRTPSGNIACTVTAEGATCTIASITFAPPVADGCTGSIGHVFTVTADGASVPCPDGPAPTVAGADVPVLDYGRVSSVGGFTCESSTSGVSCRDDATGKGFTLARAAYSLQD